MKQRFSSLDLQIISHELSTTLVGHRLSNLYDLTSRIFLLKFARPDSKHLVVIDSGFRVHLTSFTRETSPTPSSFTSKLRKYLRTRRLTSVKQLGVDRILQLTFSDGLYHLFLEFFAGGNVILTDADLNQLAVLRIVPAGDDGTGECRVGAKYTMTDKPRSGPVTKERILAALQDAVAAGVEAEAEAEAEDKGETPAKGGKKFQKKKKKVDSALKKVLGARLPEFSPVLIEHALLGAGVEPTVKAEEVAGNEEMLEKVLEAFKEAEGIIRDLTETEATNKGYIIAKLPGDPSATASKSEEEKKSVGFGSSEAVEDTVVEKVQEEGEAKGLVFDDFHPFLPRQFVGVPGIKTLEYEGFNKTVDTFFSSIEAQKLESRLKEREAAALKRLENARNDHQKRVEDLRDVQDINIRKAQTLEANANRVEEAIAAVNGLIAQGMDWVQAARLIEGEQKRGNAVAELIQLPLKLDENTITLKLRETEFKEEEAEEGGFSGFSDDDDDETDEEKDEQDEAADSQKPLVINVDLSLSAYANARNYYDQKRNAAEKETKTLKNSAKALKSTEKKITSDLKKGLKTEKQLLRPVRKMLWFEKFLFFISSDGYLVLGGRDALQNEHIYKRHFRRGDVYVHADIQGAASMIVKNNPATPNAPIPPSTLQQAGTLSVSTSTAWDSKAILSAWWVHFEQVTKLGPTGDYLAPGVFNIKGKKTFLPPAQLVLGYGVLWRVDEESKKRHMRLRVDMPEEPKKKITNREASEYDDQMQELEAEQESQQLEETKEETEQEDSDDEAFPDAKLESDAESDDEDFPDAKIESADEAEEEAQQEEDEPKAASDPEPESEPTQESSKQSAPEGPRHLSAKQRRDLKKGKAISTPSANSPSPRSEVPTLAPPPGPPKSSAPLPRGKRAKAKRAAQKYAHQDEEDLAIAHSLLGVSTTPTTKPEPEEAPKESAEARKARLREQHKRSQATGLAEEAKRQQQIEAAAEASDEDEDVMADTPLDSLVPEPRDDDTLLDAIPVCAPWGAMGRYKWRVKLQPGGTKKGKAMRDVWNAWVGDAGAKKGTGMRGAEKELVAGWKDSELVGCVPVGKVKVFGPPGSGADAPKKSSGGRGKRGGKGSKKK